MRGSRVVRCKTNKYDNTNNYPRVEDEWDDPSVGYKTIYRYVKKNEHTNKHND